MLWEDIGSNKSLGCVFSEKPDWTNTFKIKISSLTDFYDLLLRGQFWVKNESKVPGRSEKGMLWEPRVIESGRETVDGFKEDEKGKRRAFVLSSFSLSWFSVVLRYTHWHTHKHQHTSTPTCRITQPWPVVTSTMHTQPCFPMVPHSPCPELERWHRTCTELCSRPEEMLHTRPSLALTLSVPPTTWKWIDPVSPD